LEIEKEDKDTIVTILKDDLTESQKKKDDATVHYVVPFGRMTLVSKGDKVSLGQAISDGPKDIKVLHRIAGKMETVRYILNEVVKMYALQGASINQKHVEIIARQMFSRVRILNTHDTTLAEGEVVEKGLWLQENISTEEAGKTPAEAEELILGITKVALTTSSFLSAASFQETSKVLIRAALEGRKDKLLGLKENVIIGRLIPAGTGYKEEAEE